MKSTSKPNAHGRIEAAPKESKLSKMKKGTNRTLYVALPVLLVALGVLGTLKYQQFISDVKAQGVTEFKLTQCDKFTDKKQDAEWYECDE